LLLEFVALSDHLLERFEWNVVGEGTDYRGYRNWAVVVDRGCIDYIVEGS